MPSPERGEPKRAILDSYAKEHSAEYQSQALIDLARRLGPKIGDLSKVESIVIHTSHHTHTVIGTIDEVAFFVRQVARASGLPVLVDGDTGYGEALNVMNMVRTFEDAGAAAVHIEDQLLPKKCGHLNDKKLADAHDMAAKIAAAAKAPGISI